MKSSIPMLFAAFVLATSISCAAPTTAETPDLVIHNGNILTVDGEFSTAEAAAIKNGRFVAVGDDGDILAMAGDGTRVYNLKGHTVLPGFNDTHLHVISRAKRLVTQVDLSRITSIKEMQQKIAERADEVEDGEWILGSRGWWEYELEEQRMPTKAELDEAAPNNPVGVPGPHFMMVNSRALQEVGITADTPNPPGGEIYKDENGEPTGLLFDNAGYPIRRRGREATESEMVQSLKDMIGRLNANGLTSYREPGGTKDDVSLLRQLYEQGDLNIRVDFAYSVDPTLPEAELEKALLDLGPPGQTWEGGLFRADGLAEVGLDGAELTAMLRQSYPDRPDYFGLQKVSQQQYNMFCALAAKHGWRPGPHVVGDAAIDQALEAFYYAQARYPEVRLQRWMLDHAFLLIPDHYDDVKDLGLFINSQYMHNAQLGRRILAAWGRELADKSEMFKDWVENGIIFGNGADGPISYYAEPLLYIWGSVTRGTLWGGSLGPDQGLSREDAIRSVTSWSAYSSFEENLKGTIEPGKYADFVVLSDDIMAVPAAQIRDLKVLSTVLGGKIVHGELAL